MCVASDPDTQAACGPSALQALNYPSPGDPHPWPLTLLGLTCLTEDEGQSLRQLFIS